MPGILPTISRLALAVQLLLIGQLLLAADPQLNLILPRGVLRGGEHTLRFSGARLDGAQQVFLYDTSGIEVMHLTQVDASNLDVGVRVSAECRLGEHVAQVRTSSGVSDYRSFYVGALPHVDESEPNSRLDEAQAIDQNVTILGVVTSEDVDYFAVAATKGSRLSIEIEAMRLGYMFDPFIALLDAQRFEIASCDDSALAAQDGMLSILVPEDGTYFILVREASYGGDPNSRYRLHVGSYPRPTVAYPAGGPIGEEVQVQFIGDPTGPIARSWTASQAAMFRPACFVGDESGMTPSPILLRSSPFPNALESEPNDTWTEERPRALPVALNGVIATAGDMDYWKFSARKGEEWDVECYARRIGSGLDPVINIFNAATKAHVVEDDDGRRPDAYLRFSAPEDGDYYLRVRDHLSRGQEEFVYRVELTTPQPKLTFSIPRVDRYSQRRQQIVVPRGNRFATLMNAQRDNFAGELVLMRDGLPAGVVFDARPMASNLNSMPVVFEASDQAELTGALVDFRGRPMDETLGVTGGFSNLADFALGPPNNALYYGCRVDRLPIAVVDKLPFRLDLIQPRVPLVRDGTLNLRVQLTREEGFDGPIRMQFPFRPPGVGTTYQVEIPAGQSEGIYPLNANGNAQLGRWPIYCIGMGNAGGAAWVSTQLAELEIATPYVTMEIERTSCEQGQTGNIYCKLTHNTPFEGEATAQILGLPPQIVIPPVTFTKTTAELTFTVETTDASPLGKHTSAFCQVTISQHGEPMVGVAGRTEVQITPPRPQQPAVAAAVPPTDTPVAAPKPKSRLQQLREAADAGSQLAEPPR